MTIEFLLAEMRACMKHAHEAEPLSIDARSRCFVSSLSAAVHSVDSQLGAELFCLLLNVPGTKEAPCAQN